jgi:catecholate siderophore receptor
MTAPTLYGPQRQSVALLGGALALFAPLTAQAQNAPVELGPLQVEGQGANPQARPTALPRLPGGTVQDTPQVINVIPQEVLRQQNVTTLDEALRNVAGITMGVGEGGASFNGDQFRIRGFDAKDDVYVDGLRDFGVYTRDAFNIEEVEVLKGPSSSVFGRGTTGGGINTVSKAPQLEGFQRATGSVGNGPYYRTTADVNVPLDDTTAVRLNLMLHRQNVAGRDLVESNRWGIAPSVSFGLGTGTTLDLIYLHQRDERIPDYGVPTLLKPGDTVARPVTEIAPVDRSTFYGFTRDYDDSTADMVTAKLRHDATDRLTLYNDARLGIYARKFSATRVSCNAACLTNLFDGDPGTVALFIPGAAASGTGPYGMNAWGVQDVLTAALDTPIGGMRNRLVAGADASYQSSDRGFYNFSATRPGFDAFVPDHGFAYSIVPLTLATAVQSSFAESRNYAVFANDQFWLTEAWSLVAGGRLEKYAVNYDTVTVAGTRTALETSATLFSPRASVVFEPNEDQTYYLSWASSSVPQGTSVTNQPTPVSGTASPGGINTRDLAPEKHDIYEAGAKFALFDGRLGLSAAAFRIDKHNAKETDGFGNIVSSGDAQRLTGIELGVNGAVADNWFLNLNYTYLDGETVESFTGTPPVPNLAAIGKQASNTPKHAASLWTSFEPFEGVTFGIGGSYRSTIYLNNTNTALAPESFQVDALISYQRDAWRLALNASNLTDRLNYSGSTNGRVVPAPGRSFVFSASVDL